MTRMGAGIAITITTASLLLAVFLREYSRPPWRTRQPLHLAKLPQRAENQPDQILFVFFVFFVVN